MSFFNRIFLSGLLLALLAYEYYVLKGLFITNIFRMNTYGDIFNVKVLRRSKLAEKFQYSKEINGSVRHRQDLL